MVLVYILSLELGLRGGFSRLVKGIYLDGLVNSCGFEEPSLYDDGRKNEVYGSVK